jgi:cytokinin dehydrogenase
MNLDMTVGGLLSAEGLGPASHRSGSVASNVLRVDVVTGSGEIRSCTPTQDRELFGATLGGLGQCGVVTKALLAVTPAPERMRVVSMLYDDPSTWIEDQRSASLADLQVDIEGFCWAGARSLRCGPAAAGPTIHWTYSLQLAAPTGQAAPFGNLLSSLRASKKLDEYEIDYASYVARYEPRFQGMVASGAWSAPHPWFEGVVPVDAASEVLEQALRLLPPELGDGHRFLLIDTRGSPSPLADVGGGRAALIGVFPVAFSPSSLPSALGCVDKLTELVLGAGGRRYLSGWLGSEPRSYLRAHYGARYEDWMSVRRRSDPSSVLRSTLFPMGHCT